MTEVGSEVATGAANTERFSDLLRRLRVEANLTQEALAERAGLSVRAISDLERGVNRAPRFDTTRMLADGLGLSDQARAAFAASARRDAVPPGPRRSAATEAPSIAPGGVAASFSSPATSLLGREAELADVVGLLRGGDARLVTLTGPGGVGKTRLALAAAAELREGFAGGVRTVELASLDDPGLVTATVAAACGLRDVDGLDPVASLAQHLSAQPVLLVVDNCEHLVEAVGDLLARLLAACATVTVLSTSRSRLGLRREREFPLSPLSLPDAQVGGQPDKLATSPAVRLFVERAREADPGFALTDRNAAAVAGIVRRLDGLPLAIELAAARSKLLPPAALLTRLMRELPGASLHLLTGGPGELPQRQQTLRDAIAWSYDLLDFPIRALFRRLAVFAGGFTLDAADAICLCDETGGPVGAIADVAFLAPVLDGVEALLEASLLRRDDLATDPTGEGEPRFRMLETIREFGLERLKTDGDEADARTSHAAWCLALAEQAEPMLVGMAQAVWLDRLAAEHDNLRGALGWGLTGGDRKRGLRLAAALWRFWWVRGHLSEGRSWLERVLVGESDGDQAARAAALYGLATLATVQGDLARAEEAATSAISLCRASGNELGLAKALVSLGSVASYRGQQDRAVDLFEEGLFLYRGLGVKVGVPDVLNELGILAYLRGEFGRAADYYEESLGLCRELGNEQAVALVLVNLGDARRRAGELERAEDHLVEALARTRLLGDGPGVAASLTGLGQIARLRGDVPRAADRFVEASALFRSVDDAFGMAECLEGLGRCALAGDDAASAARLFGAAEVLRDGAGAPLPAALRTELDQDLAAVRAALDSDAFALAWTTGRVRPLDEVDAASPRQQP
jgi:predicted ATPase/DNA-binding XRE family transcriptional regulator